MALDQRVSEQRDYNVTYLVLDDTQQDNPVIFFWEQLSFPYENKKSVIIDCMAHNITTVLFDELPWQKKFDSALFGITLPIVKNAILSIEGIGLPENFMGKWNTCELISSDWVPLRKIISEYGMAPKLLYLKGGENEKEQKSESHFWKHGDYFHFYVVLSLQDLPDVYSPCLEALAKVYRDKVKQNKEKSETEAPQKSNEKNESIESMGNGIRHRKNAQNRKGSIADEKTDK